MICLYSDPERGKPVKKKRKNNFFFFKGRGKIRSVINVYVGYKK